MHCTYHPICVRYHTLPQQHIRCYPLYLAQGFSVGVFDHACCTAQRLHVKNPANTNCRGKQLDRPFGPVRSAKFNPSVRPSRPYCCAGVALPPMSNGMFWAMGGVPILWPTGSKTTNDRQFSAFEAKLIMLHPLLLLRTLIELSMAGSMTLSFTL